MMTKYSVCSPEETSDGKRIVSEKKMKSCCKVAALGKQCNCEFECKECGNQIVVETTG